jgi:hypothetical protein
VTTETAPLLPLDLPDSGASVAAPGHRWGKLTEGPWTDDPTDGPAAPALDVTPPDHEATRCGEPEGVPVPPPRGEDVTAPPPARRRHRWAGSTDGSCTRCGAQPRTAAGLAECPGGPPAFRPLADVRLVAVPANPEALGRIEVRIRDAIALAAEAQAQLNEARKGWDRQRAENARLRGESGPVGPPHVNTDDWHRRAQQADHWRAKYERQLANTQRVEGSLRKDLTDQIAKMQQDLDATKREVRDRENLLKAKFDQIHHDPLPAERPSLTKRFDVAGTHGYLITGIYPPGHARAGQPGELFLFVAKEGGTLRGVLDAWARLFSVALQHGVPLIDLVEKFKGCSFDPRGFTDDPSITPATSILDYVVRYLEQRVGGAA